MKNILFMIVCGIVMLCSTKVFAFETENSITVNKIKLTANKCNIRIETSEDDNIHYIYNDDKYIVETNETNGILNINANGKNSGVKSTDIMDMFVIIKIPNKDYNSIVMLANEAGISFLAKDINSNLEMTINTGSGGIYISKNFDKTVNMSSSNGSGSIMFEKDTTNYTINLKHENSGITSTLNNFQPYPNPVEYISGNGRAKINIYSKNCSFSITESGK